MENQSNAQRTAALCTSVFFDELARWGVREAVVSPGSRSTALAVCAFEYSQRNPGRFTVYVDIDERSAGFFALGLAKASGRPVALVCTSGTALANYYPAVLEAETSRVPLIVLSGDRPPHLQGLGAPQTCDQAKAYSDHVRRFIAMPLAEQSARGVAFARQAARELALAALPKGVREAEGAIVASRACSQLAGPVHANFPFDEPLMPDFTVEGAFTAGRSRVADALPAAAAAVATVANAPVPEAIAEVVRVLSEGAALVLAGEGSCETSAEALEIAQFGEAFGLPILADPLSGLRSVALPAVIDNYDNVFAREGCPTPRTVVRFGRYPLSKRCFTALARADVAGIVVDAGETRDFNYATDLFVPCSPIEFVRALSASEKAGRALRESESQRAFFSAWVRASDAERARIESSCDPATWDFGEFKGHAVAPEGAYVREIVERAPEGSCVFSANSMAIRAIDTFYTKRDKDLAVLCNRGLNGIDGTVSCALGASRHFKQTTFLTGDFTMQHDIGAFALQRELLQVASEQGKRAPSIVVVLLNNNGGGVFEMLPQASDEPYFERLFSAPQDIDFEHAAAAFHVPYRKAASPDEFTRAYEGFLGTPGISLIEVQLPLEHLKSRYRSYQ